MAALRGSDLAVMVAFVAAVSSTTAWGQGIESTSNEQLQAAQADALRQKLGSELHLRAFDLLDELVYGWTKTAPFSVDTPVIVGDVTVPYGFGSGLEALVENHLTNLVLKHPESRLRLAYCPSCAQLVVHSDKSGTVISRGIDQPAVLATLAKEAGASHALFLDFEAEGSALVLRATMTALDTTRTIVWTRTLSSSTSSGALLRAGDTLKSAEEAKAEYVDILAQRGPIRIPVRLGIVAFAPPNQDAGGIALGLPVVWIQSGAEIAINHARDWTGSIVVGGTFVPQAYSGLMLEARVNRLVTGAATSLTHPNLYLFVSGALSTLNGPAALVLRDDIPTLPDLLAVASGAVAQPTTWPTIGAGLDLRIGNRLGASLSLQSSPTLAGSPGVGRFLDYGVVQVHAIGTEVTLWF